MISPLVMANKQLSEFDKGQIVAYNNCWQSLRAIAKKLNHHHSSINVFPTNYKNAGNYHQKGYGHKRKSTAFEDRKNVRAVKCQRTVTSHNSKISWT